MLTKPAAVTHLAEQRYTLCAIVPWLLVQVKFTVWLPLVVAAALEGNEAIVNPPSAPTSMTAYVQVPTGTPPPGATLLLNLVAWASGQIKLCPSPKETSSLNTCIASLIGQYGVPQPPTAAVE